MHQKRLTHMRCRMHPPHYHYSCHVPLAAARTYMSTETRSRKCGADTTENSTPLRTYSYYPGVALSVAATHISKPLSAIAPEANARQNTKT